MSLPLGAVGVERGKISDILLRCVCAMPRHSMRHSQKCHAYLDRLRVPGSGGVAVRGFGVCRKDVGSYVTEDVRCCIDRADARSRSDRTARRV